MNHTDPRGFDTIFAIGVAHTPWRTRAECPRNMRLARERNAPHATITVGETWRAGLDGLQDFSHIIVLTWLDAGERSRIVLTPPGQDERLGVFATRAPLRPNPIGVSIAGLAALDAGAGVLTLDALDCIDGTPILDIKPYLPSIDVIGTARIADWVMSGGGKER
jgi:tRNA-Thr(GGU) m(6)t(6)A37 methyltransferase TsaA